MLNNKATPERQRALIAKELIVIAALQETKPQGQGQLQEASYTFFLVE